MTSTGNHELFKKLSLISLSSHKVLDTKRTVSGVTDTQRTFTDVTDVRGAFVCVAKREGGTVL